VTSAASGARVVNHHIDFFTGSHSPDRGFIAITTKNATSLAYALSPIMGTYVGSTSPTDFFANHSPIKIIELDQKKESLIAIYLT
jgi:hypothetical protein